MTSDEASTSLRRAVKQVRFSGDGERASRRMQPARLEWTPKTVLKTLQDKCPCLHQLAVDNPMCPEVLDALGPLPSTSHFTSLDFSCPLDPQTIITFRHAIASNLTELAYRIERGSKPLDLTSFTSLKFLSLDLEHSGRETLRKWSESAFFPGTHLNARGDRRRVRLPEEVRLLVLQVLVWRDVRREVEAGLPDVRL